MTVYIGERWDQPLVGLTSFITKPGAPAPEESGVLAICQGIGVLDLSELQYAEGDWTRDALVFSVTCPFRPTTASVSVFPQSFDVGLAPAAFTDLGWGIDNAFVTELEDDGAEVTATLVLKTISTEILRIGWNVVFAG